MEPEEITPALAVVPDQPAEPESVKEPSIDEQIKALEDQIDKQKAANKQIEDQIAALKDRLRADVCTAKDPLGKDKAPAATQKQ